MGGNRQHYRVKDAPKGFKYEGAVGVLVQIYRSQYGRDGDLYLVEFAFGAKESFRNEHIEPCDPGPLTYIGRRQAGNATEIVDVLCVDCGRTVHRERRDIGKKTVYCVDCAHQLSGRNARAFHRPPKPCPWNDNDLLGLYNRMGSQVAVWRSHNKLFKKVSLPTVRRWIHEARLRQGLQA